MRKAYRLVVFDWEGTLGDTLGQILYTIDDAAKRLNFGNINFNMAREYVSLGLGGAVEKLFPHLSRSQHEQLLHEVQHSLMISPSNTWLFPGAMEMIMQIKQAGLSLAIATNKGQQSLQRVLQASNLEGVFEVTRSAGQVPPKPCPQMLVEIMEECGVSAIETLMVGDSISDIEMANQAGVDVIGVDFYHQQAVNLKAAGAIDVIDDYHKLASYLSF